MKDKPDFIKMKNFCSGKDIVKKMIRQNKDQEKIFAKDESDIGLLSKTYKEILELNNKKTNNLIEKWTMIDTSPKKICRGKIST